MNCPKCKVELIEKEELYTCPRGDGTLLSGKLLSNAKNLSINEDHGLVGADITGGQGLMCPNCSSEMQKVDYGSTGIIIDSCPKCPYRWLDSGEIKKIKEFKPNTSSHNLLFLSELKRASEAEASEPTLSYDPSSREIKGVVFFSIITNTILWIPWKIAVAIRLLFSNYKKSKFVRFAALFFILIFGALGYWIYKVASKIK